MWIDPQASWQRLKLDFAYHETAVVRIDPDAPLLIGGDSRHQRSIIPLPTNDLLAVHFDNAGVSSAIANDGLLSALIENESVMCGCGPIKVGCN